MDTCDYCDEKATNLHDVIGVGMLCGDCAVCEYCGKLADGHYTCPDEGRKQRICGGCQEEMERGDEMARRHAAYDAYVDQKLSEWKDEGRRR
jgi:hypothetical protein